MLSHKKYADGPNIKVSVAFPPQFRSRLQLSSHFQALSYIYRERDVLVVVRSTVRTTLLTVLWNFCG